MSLSFLSCRSGRLVQLYHDNLHHVRLLLTTDACLFEYPWWPTRASRNKRLQREKIHFRGLFFTHAVNKTIDIHAEDKVPRLLVPSDSRDSLWHSFRQSHLLIFSTCTMLHGITGAFITKEIHKWCRISKLAVSVLSIPKAHRICTLLELRPQQGWKFEPFLGDQTPTCSPVLPFDTTLLLLVLAWTMFLGFTEL